MLSICGFYFLVLVINYITKLIELESIVTEFEFSLFFQDSFVLLGLLETVLVIS